MPLTTIVDYLWWATILAHAALLFRIRFSGLHKRYRFFYIYVIFRVVRSLGLVAADFVGARAYAQLWVATEPVLWFLYVLVVLEVYTLVLQEYKGLATVGRWVLMAGLTLGLIVSALTLGPDLSGPKNPIQILSAIDRGVLTSLLVFLLCITGFLLWYPVRLSRNVIVYCVGYAVYFVACNVVILFRNMKWDASTWSLANAVLSGVTLICLLVWTVLLTPRGETVTVERRPQWTTADEQHLVRQLDAINASLLRVARK